MCLEVGGPVCIMTKTMGTSTLEHRQHKAASCSAGAGTLSDTRHEDVGGESERSTEGIEGGHKRDPRCVR